MSNPSFGGVEKTPIIDPAKIERPAGALLRYYLLVGLCSGPLFPITFLPLYFKFNTLKYKFDESGVSMSWGILFRREIHLTYRRIQDIHLNRNLLQRWMGLATLGIQTASGSAAPEMSIEGILEAEPLRDYLYSQMRGARGEQMQSTDSEATDDQPADQDQVTVLLTEIRDAMQKMAEKNSATATATIAEPPKSSDGGGASNV